MLKFADNILYLRNQKKWSQKDLAERLSITRDRYKSYENGRSQPPFELLIQISKLFHISIDLLLTVDIKRYPIDEMLRLPDNRIVLPVIVDENQHNYIEIVPQKASMGYLKGYSDPDYIEGLPRMSLPFLTNGKYRAFMADGDSMPPFADGSYIIGEYVESFEYLTSGKEYIIVTQEGITYKTFVSISPEFITVAADESFYDPFDIRLEDILEIWRYTRGILPKDYTPNKPDNNDLKNMISLIQKDVMEIKSKIEKK